MLPVSRYRERDRVLDRRALYCSRAGAVLSGTEGEAVSARRGQFVGAENPNWRGGRSIASNGYVLIRVGKEHHLADVRGYAYEHRLVAEQKLGRRLLPGEVAHHKDENKQNNDPDNLEVLTGWEHRVEHRTGVRDLRHPGESNPLLDCACGCGGQLEKFDASGRPRRFIVGHNDHPSPTAVAVLAVLQVGPARRDALAKAAGRDTQAIASLLTKLQRRGLVLKRGRGVWALKETG